MPGVTKEQIKQAKEVDLLTYLQTNEPHEIVKSKYGSNEYRTVTYSGLVISNGLWFWNKGQIGGKSAIDYLMKIRGMGFVDAVRAVVGDSDVAFGARASSAFSVLPVEKAKPSLSKPKFKLPETAQFPSNAIAYLQKRGISPDVIGRCLELGIIAETKKYQNVMFIDRDENNVARFACVRGTKSDFKSDVLGSSKMYSFTIPAINPGSRHLFCFESPIDALSHVTLQQRNGWNFDSHRLALGGTSDVALISFLERHPQITRITLHLDNDAAGLFSARKIEAQLGTNHRFKHIHVSVNPPRGAKDYNELLCKTIALEREQKQQNKQNNRNQR